MKTHRYLKVLQQQLQALRMNPTYLDQMEETLLNELTETFEAARSAWEQFQPILNQLPYRLMGTDDQSLSILLMSPLTQEEEVVKVLKETPYSVTYEADDNSEVLYTRLNLEFNS